MQGVCVGALVATVCRVSALRPAWGPTAMTWRLGVDIGGTFTDFALFDERGYEIAVLKRLTTPADPSIAVIEGTAALLRREDVPMAEVDTIAHGTTLVTNAVIERRGAKTGMLVTAGFRDILDMGFEQRYDLFDLRITWPDPLVPRRLRREVGERVGHDGQVLAALDLESTRAAIRDLVETAGVEAFAICFLHSYANPVHEEAAGELVRAEFPDLHVSRSAEVFGNMREYASIAGGARAREKRARKVWFGDAFVECEALDRYALEVGTTVEGPAVSEERESTCVLGPGDRATVGARLNLVAELANEESDS